jgi:hypothetical protein
MTSLPALLNNEIRREFRHAIARSNLERCQAEIRIGTYYSCNVVQCHRLGVVSDVETGITTCLKDFEGNEFTLSQMPLPEAA